MKTGSAQSLRSLDDVKTDIVKLAEEYSGEGDPDFTKQRALNRLVKELLRISPQPPVSERLKLLFGPWKQVWGPYDYRSDKRGVDPKITVDEIYQVIFKSGYYYNVNPIAGKDKTALLRGEYELVNGYPNMLRVRFTDYPGNKGDLEGYTLWELPDLAEAGELPNETTIVPTFIVRLFFGGGALREVYTDSDLRITYGGDSVDDRSDEYIYILKRVK